MEENNKKIKAYKGFDKNMSCRGFKYEVGKEYETSDADVVLCKKGFHACENPLDVLDFYSDIDGKYCVVEQSGKTETDGKKTASSRIKIIAEVGFVGLFKLGIEWLKEITSPQKVVNKDDGYSSQISSSESHAQIGSTGDYAKIGSSGYSAQIGSSGDSAQIGSSGDSAQIGSSGYFVKIGSSGYFVKIGSSDDYAQIGSSGNYAQIGSTGHYAQIGSSGNYAQIGSTGHSAQIGSSGDYAQIASLGNYSIIGSSGYSAQIDSTGDYTKIGSSGYHAKINSEGSGCVICCAGNGSIARAKKGSWITLSEWVYDEEKKREMPICVKSERVDGKRIKEDVFYKLEKGEFVEVEQYNGGCT